MVPNNSQDQLLYLITALLRDVQALHSEVISPESLQLSCRSACERVMKEGHGFLTKALPRLGKALDSALSGVTLMDAVECGFRPIQDSKLPELLGELFQRVFTHDGRVRLDPCVSSIKSLRQFLYVLYKYELPYDNETEALVLSKFKETEMDVKAHSKHLSAIADTLEAGDWGVYGHIQPKHASSLIRKARLLLYDLFRRFDSSDICPNHGPGAVSTKEKLWAKWEGWNRVSPRILETYPLDSYFYANLNHVSDRLESLSAIELGEDSARVVLVPKDSRGPRLISCEPLAFQWIQQGLSRAIVRHVERHPLTRYNVHFTDQRPNQRGALLGSLTGKYGTLDLNEASDRVSVGLVKLLFPGPLSEALLNCRSLSTELPSKDVLTLHKYAPMGSALCFPVLALSVWAILTAGAPDADTSDGILVYGDDVIVPTEYAVNAIEHLELFGLKVNQSKSYTSGLFRESCGVDAFAGVDVTPVRIRTVWSSNRSPEVLASWCSYANSFHKNAFTFTYELIAGWILSVYGKIPEVSQGLSCPSLNVVPESMRPKSRYKNSLRGSQWESPYEFRVWDVVPRTIEKSIDGWSMLHRFFVMQHYRPHEGCECLSLIWETDESIGPERAPDFSPNKPSALSAELRGGRRALKKWKESLISDSPFSVCSYTKPRDTKLVRRWLLSQGTNHPQF